MNRKIKVLIVEPEKEPYEKLIDNTLKSLQNEVEGYIEIVSIELGVDLIVNEEGKINSMPFNRYINNDMIVGTFIVAGEKNGEIVSLSPSQIKKYKEYFEWNKHAHLVEMYKNKYNDSSELISYEFIGGY